MGDVLVQDGPKPVNRDLNEEGHRDEAAGLIPTLIDRIVLTPNTTGTRLMVDLEGDLAGILAIAENGAVNAGAKHAVPCDLHAPNH